jgi:hypothetical protein
MLSASRATLRLSGAQGIRKLVPYSELTSIGEFQLATDIALLIPHQVTVALLRIDIAACGVAVEEAEGHKGIKEIPRTARMHTGLQRKVVERKRPISQHREHIELDGTQQGLGLPEGETEPHYPIRRDATFVHPSSTLD